MNDNPLFTTHCRNTTTFASLSAPLSKMFFPLRYPVNCFVSHNILADFSNKSVSKICFAVVTVCSPLREHGDINTINSVTSDNTKN